MRRRPHLPLEELAPYLLNCPSVANASGSLSVANASGSLFDFREIFGNDHPVELEVGFGKGLFLLMAAQQHPDINFVGIEIVRKYQLFAATRMAKRSLGNVRLTCADVRFFLPRYVADTSLQAVHVYFPDPWWKTRHRKRRVFTAEFTAECVRILRPGGWLHAVTDVEEYAAVMVALLDAQSALRPLTPPSQNEPLHDLDYLTNFERKFRKQGKPIFRMLYEKNPTAKMESVS